MRDVDAAYAGVCEQLRLLAAGELTARRLTEIYLARIAKYDRELNAFRLVFAAEAMRAAEWADEQRAAGSSLPLLGIPIAIKEDQAIAGVPTTMGTRAVHTPAAEDGELVRRLRAAGAVIIGQTRCSELCLFTTSSATHAGQVRNPWVLDRSAGGSSGGSAVAVAAGLASGSDCGGSIRIPSAYTGLFGLKPQTDRISSAPREEIWTGLGTLGMLTRGVADSALLLAVAAGSDYPVTDPGRLRIAMTARPWMPLPAAVAPVKAALDTTARSLVGLGHRLVEHRPRYLDRGALRSYIPRYLTTAREDAALLDDPDALEPPAALMATLGKRVSARGLAAAKRSCAAVAAAANETFTEYDLLLTPAVPRPAPRLRELLGTLKANQYSSGFTALWNIAGNPAAAVPAGFTASGLPLAVQLIGPPHSEALLLSVAAQLEDASEWTSARPPRFS